MASPSCFKVLVDHAEGARIAQLVVERIGLRRVERGEQERHGRDRRELARSEDLAGEQLAKQRDRRRAAAVSASFRGAVRSTRIKSSRSAVLCRTSTWLPARNGGWSLVRRARGQVDIPAA